MPGLELLTGFVTEPGTTLTALTMASGNSLTIRNATRDSKISLIQVWVDSQAAGIFRVRSPQLHDNVQGLRFRHVLSEVDPLMADGFAQPLKAQDTLVAELSGSATAGDIETACLLVYYADLPGINGRFIAPDALAERTCNILTIENTLSLGTSAGYSGEEAINAEFGLLKANTDYAILGYHVSAECAAIRYRGIDFGNLGLGGPGNEASKQLTGNWFARLSRRHNLPLIPIFNSANSAGVLVDGAQDENGDDVTLTTILCQLDIEGT